MKHTVTETIQNLEVDKNKGSTHMQWIFTILVNLTSLSYGLQVGWPFCVANVLQSERSPTSSPLSVSDVAWLSSVPSLSALVSIPMWTYVVDRFGRKPCVVLTASFYFISWLIIYFATNMATLVVARVFSGTSSAAFLYIIAMYVKEISQDDLRGVLGIVTHNSRNFGLLFMYLMGGYLEYYTILYICIAVAATTLVIIVTAPESPTFYVKIGQLETAAATIAKLRTLQFDDQEVQKALDSIKAEDEKFKSIDKVTFLGIFKQKSWRNGFVCMTLMMAFHGLNGGYAILNFGPLMLEMSNVTVNPELLRLCVPIFMIIGSFVSMIFIERLGRKPIMMTSFVTSMLSFGALAAVVVAQRGGASVPEWVAVVLIVIPVFGFAAAVSPLPFVIMAEMFNFQIRAKIMGCLVLLGWVFGFVQAVLFGQISVILGPEITFIFFSIVNLAGILVCVFLLPETKGKSVPEIENDLER